MSKMMSYKGYKATFEYDSDDNFFVGKVHGLSDSLNFHGRSIDELTATFHQSVDNYLELCKTIGKTPEKEYSGVFNIRISPGLHRKLADTALKNSETINSLVTEALYSYLH